MEPERPFHSAAPRCVLCQSCVNRIRVGQQSACAAKVNAPLDPWTCDHYVRQFRRATLDRRRELRGTDRRRGQ